MQPLSSATTVRVSSIQVRALIEAVGDAGSSVATFLARTGLDSERMADSQCWFTLEEYDELVTVAVEVSGDPAFGLHWGERSPMVQFDLAAILVATAPTLRAALESLLRFQPIVVNRQETTFRELGNRGVICGDMVACSELGRRVRDEVAMTGFSRLLRYWNVPDALRRVDFTHARPDYGEEYDRLFGARVHFDQPRTRLEFARSVLDLSSPHRDAELHQVVRAT